MYPECMRCFHMHRMAKHCAQNDRDIGAHAAQRLDQGCAGHGWHRVIGNNEIDSPFAGVLALYFARVLALSRAC